MLRERVKGAARSVDDFGGDYVIVQPSGTDEIAASVDAWRNAGGDSNEGVDDGVPARRLVNCAVSGHPGLLVS